MVYVIGVLVSFVVYIALGFIVNKKVKKVEDYYVAGRNAPVLFITGSLVASYVSTVAFMGELGFAYDGYAMPLITMMSVSLFGYFFGAFYFGRYLRRSNVLTLPEYFGKRFNSNKVRRVAAITLILGIISYLVAVTQGAALLMTELTGFNYEISLILVTITYTLITFLSGAMGVLLTDTVMFIVFVGAAFISIPLIVKATGGWPEAYINSANLSVKSNLFSWHGITGEGAYLDGSPFEVLLYCLILGIVWGGVIAVSPWQTSRYLMAKNEHVTIRSAVISTLIIGCFYIYFFPPIVTVNTLNPAIEPSERVFIWVVMNHVPEAIGVIAICGIFAAALSSNTTFLQLIGNSVTRDLIIDQNLSDKKLLMISRLVMLGVGLITLIITLFQPPAIFWIAVFAATLFAASWGPVAFASVHSRKVTKPAAFWSILSGFVGVVITELAITFNIISLPLYLNSAVFGFLCSLSTLIVISRFTTPTPEEIEFREALLAKSVASNHNQEILITKRYPKILIIGGILIIISSLVLYYYPIYILGT